MRSKLFEINKSQFYATGTMKTADGLIYGTVRYNSFRSKWQSNIDGELSGEFKTPEQAVTDLKDAGVKNIKINKAYSEHLDESKKFTKKDLVEMVRKVIKEQSFPIHPKDSLMHGITYEDLIDTVFSNEQVRDERTVRRVFEEMIRENAANARENDIETIKLWKII